LLETIQNIDQELFLFFNGIHNSFFDFVMYWVSNKFIWIPMYAWFIYLIIKKYKWQTILILILVALMITISDQVTVFFKNYFERPRPCHDEYIGHLVHTVKNACGGPYGFMSGHAASSFSLAVFLIPLIGTRLRYFKLFLIFWATTVAYSRVYLGVHYPGDIFCGALLGILLGYIFSRLFFLLEGKVFRGKEK
jgi:undecaprenyl-diphosphatase